MCYNSFDKRKSDVLVFIGTYSKVTGL
jgi:hypothetical protein